MEICRDPAGKHSVRTACSLSELAMTSAGCFLF
nr:MAG TPA: hypothetical protein [Caudoviricetes sp.]